jgi:hypothetical protein
MLWINNDESLQTWAREHVRDYVSDHDATDDNRIYLASQALQQWAEIAFTRSGYAEYIGDSYRSDSLVDIAEDIGSLYRINYYECAEGILSDMALETVEG